MWTRCGEGEEESGGEVRRVEEKLWTRCGEGVWTVGEEGVDGVWTGEGRGCGGEREKLFSFHSQEHSGTP